MRRRPFARVVAALVFSLGLSGIAHGTHPLNTDDPDVQGAGGHQVEINTDWLRQGDAGRRIASVTYTYGVTDLLDAYLAVPVSLNTPSGMSDAAIGLKWQLLDVGAVTLALKPELSLPTGDALKSLGNGKTGGTLTGIASYDAAPWRLIGNLGVSINRYQLQSDRDANRSVVWRASASALYTYRKGITLVADVGLERDIDKGSDKLPAYAIAGIIYSPNPQLDLDAGVRLALNCDACPAQVRRQVGVGLTCRF